jgi:hypothetical protein
MSKKVEARIAISFLWQAAGATLTSPGKGWLMRLVRVLGDILAWGDTGGEIWLQKSPESFLP